MTTAAQAGHGPAAPLQQGAMPGIGAPGNTGAVHRRADRRRRTIERVIAIFVVVAAFAVTVVLLGLQWLGNPSTSSSAPPPPGHIILTSEVQPS